MLAGCSSSSLLSPTRRLRSEAVAATSATVSAHFPMNTQRLDLPCSSSFSRKETPSSRPLGRSISLDNSNNNNNKPIERKTKTSGCSLKQNIKLPPLATTRGNGEGFSWNNDNNNRGKSLKRLAEEDESCLSRAKRTKCENEGDDEEKVCFVPSEVISQPLPNWVDSVITELAGIGDKDVESSLPAAVKEASGGSSTSASSESRSLSHRVPEPTNGSRNPYSHRGATEERTTGNINNNNNRNDLQRDFELVNLLTGCLDAIRSRNIAAINHFIARTGDLASPRGRTPMTRLIAYYIEALALRVARMWPHIFHIAPPREFDRTVEDESGNALRFLNQVTPIPKFIHFTANEMLLRAFEGKERVHIIDFDIKQGLQWPSFFQSLASRINPPHHVRITGIGESKLELNETGDRLHGFAEAMNLQFEFHPVVDRLEDVRLWMLHVKEGESVAVNCVMQMHKTLYDGTGAAIRDFLGLIRSTNPIALVLAEQEAEHNSEQLETRVCNSLKYYSAMFDAIHTNLATDSLMRVKVEEMLFGREIRNIVACEGSHRQERHVGFRHWRRMLEQLGFRSLGVSEREVLQSKMLLRMYGSDNEGFFNVERSDEDNGGEGGRGGGVTLRWSEQPLYTISAWTTGGN
ncbi:Transcription factor GRAS [Arabidopsis thaliana x Arabidopsis arenosa]|uniref:GRAS family transcription factor n=2 Tax=Arabidopsis TaxID=3701 RepID=A0A2H1ZEE0_ARATH|nr:GRAS family transcription factor [Arabidopsis thaliana]AEE34053.2 GRAS family transcription factor [Arabidopsis thaliana]KAG7650384.1 Transcription factor GRAS [Arabidopsis thaliana x Arabidopsis arenosa]|eukprot:NP_001319298.1 GRAS family transcription factor [Arabidopsis thaliana]